MKKLRPLYRLYARLYNFFTKKNNLTHYFFYSYKQHCTDFGIIPYEITYKYFKNKPYTEMVSIFEKYDHCNNDYSWNNWDDAKLLGLGNINDIKIIKK